ncbi:MAG: hypothetical protein HFG77_11315 [Hungatella sp.]|nr:hypothetical protein [Hungatella sp.]
MKFIKRGTAVLLAALLTVPTQPATAAYAKPIGATEGQKSLDGDFWEVDFEGDFPSTVNLYTGTASNSEKSSKDEVKFNTGNYQVTIVDQEAFDRGEGDGFFEEDGSYTIHIPESNPYFPYEVQFTGSEGTASKWFETPDDSVVIDGHRFYVSAYFDGQAVTQMSLDVAGKTVVVYPEKKEFTDGDGAQEASLLPLVEKQLTVDLTGFTPVELTMVKISSIFTGEDQLKDTDKVIWTYNNGDDKYTVSAQEETIDMSYRYGSWQMIVGDDDQLAAENIRYIISTTTTDAEEWLVPTVYKQDSEGNRTKVNTVAADYDSYSNGNRLFIRATSKEISREELETAYVGLEMNTAVFETPGFDHFKVYEGQFSDPAKAQTEGTDITDQLFAPDMTVAEAGIRYPKDLWVTMISYDQAGNVTGCLPFELSLYRYADNVSCYSLYAKDDKGNTVYVTKSSSTKTENDCRVITIKLRYGYPADGKYFPDFEYTRLAEDCSELVTAAYVGTFSTIKEAAEAGAEDKKGVLFLDSAYSAEEFYEADFSQGVYFTFFVGEDGSENQEVYHCCIKTEEGDPEEFVLSDSTNVSFYGLYDGNGRYVRCLAVDRDEDSYGDYSYRTILVDSDVDLTCLAPTFSVSDDGINLYASEGNSESVLQVSGKSVHDFSKGPVHYTASSENKEVQRNYWLQVVKKTEGAGQLYINSLADPDAETETDSNGVVTSTREMILDGRYDYYHDILLINQNTGELANLKAEIDSAEVELDPYWTLNGQYPLSGFDTLNRQDINGDYVIYGELANMAKLRVVPKENMADGREITGTLTIKSGEKTLMVLTLTGTVGDPSITTTEVPEAVKYVPYGTMIQNSNKYDWNEVSYELMDGTLPAGMVIKPNGELYGVPTETGEFSFTVFMDNSFEKFADSEKTLTLTVIDNTNENVDAATDQGYELTSRVMDVALTSDKDQVMVSAGEFGQFVDLYLDGVKLKKDEDYTAESGSTRITVKNQTLKGSKSTGTHTLGAEFRDEDDNLKRAAQNYEVTEKETNPGGNNPGGNHPGGDNPGGNNPGGDNPGGNPPGGSIGGGNGSSGGSSGSGSSSTTPAVNEAARKGQVDPERGIITGEGSGYCRWQQNDSGWQLIYTDGTAAKGTMVQRENGESVEQVLWEMVNGSWYAFGADGYVKSGWVYDYQLDSWYLTSADTGMMSGWYKDPQDQKTYYMDPVTGKLAAGWNEIDGKWYYFQAVSTAPTWEFNKETGNWSYNVNSGGKPFGSMYLNERTPDGYFVNIQGIWDGRNPQ